MSWANRINLEKYIWHDDARKKIAEILAALNKTDESIGELHIITDSGYVMYTVICGKDIKFTVSDSGSVIN